MTARFAAALQSTSGLVTRTSQVARIFLDFEEVTTQSARSGSGGRVAAAGGMPYVPVWCPFAPSRPPVAAPPEPRPPTAPPPSAADFPGCKPVRLPREQLDDTEMRLEYWHAATETAWICDPVSSYHEGPSRHLGRLAERIAAVRGTPVECLGSTDLAERDAHGEPQLIMQADELVYLHPARAKLPRAGADGRRARPAGGGAGSGSHHRRAAPQAGPVPGVGVPGGVARGAGGSLGEPPAEPAVGTDDPPAGRWRVSGVGGEPCVSRAGRRWRFTRR